MAIETGFKSYCWSVGTTSYRTDKFNMNIEKQLKYMKEFRNLPENAGKVWIGNNAFQAEYYLFLKAKGFVKGDAQRPDKDAREKTSGLRDIGLLDDERNLTEAGEELLAIAETGDFSADNLLEIPRDSFVYFRQMIKTCNDVDGKKVRPFVVFLYVISKTKYLTYHEFTYLLPLCVDKRTTDKIIDKILSSRNNTICYEDIILSVLMDMENYRFALYLLQTEPITEELICSIGMNRKSAKYDKGYYALYRLLKEIVFGSSDSADSTDLINSADLVIEFYNATNKIKNSKVGSAWRKYFFQSTARSVMKKKGRAVLNQVPILQAQDKKAFHEEFFKIMHLFKAKATLSDYFDLNRRYFKITDTVLFEDDKVKLDVLPGCYVECIKDRLAEFAFQETDLLEKAVSLEEIHPCLDIKAEVLYRKLSELFGTEVRDTGSARQVIWNERYVRLNRLIDERFSSDALIYLLTCFEERNDDEIRRLVTDNADIPTIFEYVLGIAWYMISGRTGDVLEYMNLSLEADLLPKTHAGGGEADIVWKYEKTSEYPEHTLLIEATLADRGNQRRMEMEPVSRHLGDYRLANPETEVYCIFTAAYLHPNVIADFRGRRYMEYYNSAGKDYIQGMKILPMQTSELKMLLRFRISYPELYTLLEKAYHVEEPAAKWYEENIVQKIKEFPEKVR